LISHVASEKGVGSTKEKAAEKGSEEKETIQKPVASWWSRFVSEEAATYFRRKSGKKKKSRKNAGS